MEATHLIHSSEGVQQTRAEGMREKLLVFRAKRCCSHRRG